MRRAVDPPAIRLRVRHHTAFPATPYLRQTLRSVRDVRNRFAQYLGVSQDLRPNLFTSFQIECRWGSLS